MPELLVLPDPSWSPIQKAFYCRARALQMQELARHVDPLQREDRMAVARRWQALARHYESEPACLQMGEGDCGTQAFAHEQRV